MFTEHIIVNKILTTSQLSIEKLGICAAAEVADDKVCGKRLDQQKLRLKNNQVKAVMEELQAHKAGNFKEAGLLKEVVAHYKSNITSMQYKTCLEQGYPIGSGAMESTHLNVIRQRLKLSGQRWYVPGLQAMVNLRDCKKADQWKILIDCIKGAE